MMMLMSATSGNSSTITSSTTSTACGVALTSGRRHSALTYDLRFRIEVCYNAPMQLADVMLLTCLSAHSSCAGPSYKFRKYTSRAVLSCALCALYGFIACPSLQQDMARRAVWRRERTHARVFRNALVKHD